MPARQFEAQWGKQRQSCPPLLSSHPCDAPLFRNFGPHGPQSQVSAPWYVHFVRRLISPHTDHAFLSLLLGLYVAFFDGCAKALYRLYNKWRQMGRGNHRLILVSTTLFVLIVTWVRCLPLNRAFHSSPIQHLVLDII